jgi:glutamate/tyrosine decarboxylase-like PLP-dependent enzyme
MTVTATAIYIKKYLENSLICVAGLGSLKTTADSQPAADGLVIVTARPLSDFEKHTLVAALTTRPYAVQTVQVVYEQDLLLSLQGYGFVQQDGRIDMNPVADSQQTVFTAYRTPYMQLAAPTRFLTGDIRRYDEFVQRAQKTLACMTLQNYKARSFSFEEFSAALLAGAKDYPGFNDTPDMRAYIAQSYWPILTSLVSEGTLKNTKNRLSVVDRNALALPGVKDYDLYQMEQQYLGAHESADSWQEYMDAIAAAGLAAYKTERPLTYRTPAEMQELTAAPLPETGTPSIPQLVSELDELVNTYSINQSTVNFTAFPESGNSKAAVATAMLAPAWNQNLISVDKSGPISTFIEVQVIQWLRQLVGYKCEPTTSAVDMGGVAATGGVMSNTVGLLVARSLVFPASRKSGLTAETKKPFLLVAEKTLEHYSHKAAFWWLGLGEDNVIPVKAKGYDFDINDLKQKIKKYHSGSNVIVAVMCMAGDSRTMAIQNIGEVYAETSKHGIWLHVDACQGGVGLFSKRKEELCGEYRLADSISIDPHKGLGVPYSSSFCLFKDQRALSAIAKSTDITIAKGTYDIGQVTPFLGSRPFDTVKVWSLLKFHGLDGLTKNIDHRIAVTKKWAQLLNESTYFTALHNPTLTAVSFSIDPRKADLGDISDAELGMLNKQLHDRCYQEGWLVVHCFDLIDFENRLGLPEAVPLRVLGTNFGNALLDENHLPKMIAHMEHQMAAILEEYVAAQPAVQAEPEEVTATNVTPATALDPVLEN